MSVSIRDKQIVRLLYEFYSRFIYGKKYEKN